MDLIKISVIIPVYNTALYLREAICSVFNQTLQDIEIIAVNDGSEDDSLQVLNELAVLDKRLKVVSYDKNVGVSVCRNRGVDIATGKYIYFFDSDDLLDPDCLNVCFAKMESGNYDFIVFDGESFTEDGLKMGFNATYQRTRLMKNNVYKGVELIQLLIQQKSYSCSVCLCVINREFILKNKLQFYPGVLYEDVLYSAHMYLIAQSVGFVPGTFFRRRIRKNSTMTSKISQVNIDYRYTVATELLKLKSNFTDKNSRKVLNNQSKSLLMFLSKSLLRNGQIALLIKNFFQIAKIILRSW